MHDELYEEFRLDEEEVGLPAGESEDEGDLDDEEEEEVKPAVEGEEEGL